MRGQKGILAAGLFTYVFLAPFFFHPDLKTILYLSGFFGQGVFNIYEFIAQSPDKAFLGPFVYPPLAYFLFGFLQPVIKLVAGGGFSSWLGMGNDAVAVGNIHQYLFAMKLPLILIHVVTGLLLVRLLKGKVNALLVLLLWFFNPIGLYVVALMGQFDGIPVFLTVLSLYFANRRPALAAFLLGVGGALKSYPLLFLPFLAVLAGRSTKERFKLFGWGILPYLVSILPFALSSAFWEDVLVSGLSQRVFQLSLPLGYGEQILVIPAVLVVLFLYALKHAGKKDGLFSYFLVVALLIVAGSHFHPQWALWALPFLLVVVVQHRLWVAGVFFFTGWLGTTFLFDDIFLTWGLLGPVDAGVLFLPTPYSLMQRYFDPALLRNLLHTLMVVAALWVSCVVLVGGRRGRLYG